MTTKEQERKALEKIRKIVEELGEGSYVGTAFEGCFEIAEENIENDWSCSMKQRYDIELGRATGLASDIEDLRNKLKTAELNERDLREAVKRAKAEASETITALREKALSPDDLTDTIQLVTEKQFSLDAEVKNAAERIVEAAAEPESAAFQNAVKDHRAAKSSLDYYTTLLERLIKARGE